MPLQALVHPPLIKDPAGGRGATDVHTSGDHVHHGSASGGLWQMGCLRQWVFNTASDGPTLPSSGILTVPPTAEPSRLRNHPNRAKHETPIDHHRNSAGFVLGRFSYAQRHPKTFTEADISAVQSRRSGKSGGCGSVCFRPIVKPHRNRSWNKRPSVGLSASFKPASKFGNRSPSAPSEQTEVDRR
jgi:hypothetical protein